MPRIYDRKSRGTFRYKIPTSSDNPTFEPFNSASLRLSLRRTRGLVDFKQVAASRSLFPLEKHISLFLLYLQ